MNNINEKRRKVMMKGEIRCNEYIGIAMRYVCGLPERRSVSHFFFWNAGL